MMSTRLYVKGKLVWVEQEKISTFFLNNVQATFIFAIKSVKSILMLVLFSVVFFYLALQRRK